MYRCNVWVISYWMYKWVYVRSCLGIYWIMSLHEFQYSVLFCTWHIENRRQNKTLKIKFFIHFQIGCGFFSWKWGIANLAKTGWQLILGLRKSRKIHIKPNANYRFNQGISTPLRKKDGRLLMHEILFILFYFCDFSLPMSSKYIKFWIKSYL